MPRLPYSKEHEAIIAQWAGIKTAEEIGMMIGRTRASVLQKGPRMGFSLRQTGEDHYKAKLSNLQVEMIHALIEGGFRVCEIHQAAFNHVHVNTVHSVVSSWSRVEK
jgi:hypothetical protein